MKAAFVCALPFHRWIMEDLATAMEAIGWEVTWLIHRRQVQHDWLERNPNGDVMRTLRESTFDVVICAEYPYRMLQEASDAPVVGLRHSLAARGNTWQPEHSTADFIVTWSPFDREMFDSRSVRINGLMAGCVWAQRLALMDSASGLDARKAMGLDNARPVVAWCPTWNEEFNCGENVVTALLQLEKKGIQIVVRSHPGRWGSYGIGAFCFDDPEKGPWNILAAADVLITDVSGIGLLPVAMSQHLPVVWVDPSYEALTGCHQYDPTGPEWEFRRQIGQQTPAGTGLYRTIGEAINSTSHVESQAAVRERLLGSHEWTGTACTRAAKMITEALGIGTTEPTATIN